MAGDWNRRLHLGTSGYVYGHWKGIFYPRGVPPSRWLEYYARFFDTVELNGTFYRLPPETAVDRWRENVPADFLFVCKGSRFLTHMKRLLDTGLGLERFYRPVLRLGVKLGPILWQLPPTFKKPDLARLDRFLAAQPEGTRHAIEFRDPAWYTKEVCDLLDRYGAAFCEHDRVDRAPPRLTGGWRYIRFHGPSGGGYHGRYGTRRLEPFARKLKTWLKGGREAFVYFNNDMCGAALYDAQELGRLLGLPIRISLPPWREQ
jgi:uncharacterized protein YecE (DUF72 family)